MFQVRVLVRRDGALVRVMEGVGVVEVFVWVWVGWWSPWDWVRWFFALVTEMGGGEGWEMGR